MIIWSWAKQKTTYRPFCSPFHTQSAHPLGLCHWWGWAPVPRWLKIPMWADAEPEAPGGVVLTAEPLVSAVACFLFWWKFTFLVWTLVSKMLPCKNCYPGIYLQTAGRTFRSLDSAEWLKKSLFLTIKSRHFPFKLFLLPFSVWGSTAGSFLQIAVQ